MSIGSATSAPNPALMALLSQLTATQGAASDNSSFTPASPAAPSCGGAQAANNQVTGSGSASISGEILKLLVQMQQQLGSAGTGSTTTASTSTMTNPINQLFAAMDSDADGSVSESEMEGYVEKQGATQAQADALYTQLDPNSASGITQPQLAQAGASGGGHRHHHHHVGGGSDQMASSLMQTLDSDGDGSDTPTTASLTATWENLQNTQASSSSGPIMASLLDTLAKTNAATVTVSTTA